jgi:hypothetical protein
MTERRRVAVIAGVLGAVCVGYAPGARADGPTKDECINANDAAQTARQAGKLHEAKKQLLVCVAKSCPGPVRDDCTERLNEVEKAMPTVVFAATDAQGNDLSDVRVSVDGEALAARLDGTPVEVDPGTHVFRFDGAGARWMAKKVTVREAEKLRSLSVAFAYPPASEPADGGRAQTGAGSEEASTPSRWPAYVAFALGGAGLVTGVAAAIFTVRQKSKCDGITTDQCDRKYNDYSGTLTADNVGWIAGFSVAAIGAGIGTFLVLSQPAEPAARAGSTSNLRIVAHVGLGWAGVEGRF